MPEMPNTFRDDLKNLVAHAKLKVGETELMFSDAPSGSPIPKGKQVTICITTNGCGKIKTNLRSPATDGQVNMPLEETPFSPGFGDVTDNWLDFPKFTQKCKYVSDDKEPPVRIAQKEE